MAGNVVPFGPLQAPADLYGFRSPPHNIEAEQALLGAILVNNLAYDKVAKMLAEQHFYEPVHARIFAACKRAIDRGIVADYVTIHEEFDQDEALKDLDRGLYLARLARSAEAILNAESYAVTIVDCWLKRQIIAAAEAATNRLYDASTPETATEQLKGLQGDLDMIAKSQPAEQGPRHIVDVVFSIVQRLDDIETGTKRAFFSTGLKRLDGAMNGGMNLGEVYSFEAATEQFKAQPVSEPVLLRNGEWRPIGDLRIGDALASPDGSPSRVVGVYPQGRRPVFRVTFSDGRSVRADGEHLWLAATGLGRPIVATTSGLAKLAKTRRAWIPRISGDFGGGVDLPVSPYLLGVLLGDGCLSDASRIRFSTVDAGILQAVGDYLPAAMHVTPEDRCDYRISAVGKGHWRKNTLIKGLRALGLVGCRSHTKFIPEMYFTASRGERLDLLRGLLDTDSQAYEGRAIFVTTSPLMADGIQRLARSLGMIATAAKPTGSSYSYRGEIKTGRTVYRVSIRADRPQELCSLARKKAALLASRKINMRLRVVSVEPDGEEQCVCIKISHPSSLYVTSGYTLTHNTGMLATVALNLMAAGVPVLYFAMEMGSERITERLIGSYQGLNSQEFRRAENPGALIEQSMAFATRARNYPGWLHYQPGMSFDRLRALANDAVAAPYNVRVIFIDYWQLVTGMRKGQSKVEHLADVAQWMETFASQRQIVIVSASQTNRDNAGLWGDGLFRASTWQKRLHKFSYQDKFIGATECLWLEHLKDRHGASRDIGGKNDPAFYIAAKGPVARDWGDW